MKLFNESWLLTFSVFNHFAQKGGPEEDIQKVTRSHTQTTHMQNVHFKTTNDLITRVIYRQVKKCFINL
jgi:hypothetical protein